MKGKKRRSGLASIVELVVIVAIALGLALLIQAFLVKPYRIPSESMEPTLDVGQRVIVNRLEYKFGDPDRRDIIVFHPPAGAERGDQCAVPHSRKSPCPKATSQEADVNFIKRIVGLPGDRLAVKDGIAVINGKPLKEAYIRPCGGMPACNLPKSIKIPAGHYFMMGDNRGASDDSRFWGPIPKDSIIGEAFFTYWPIKRIGTL